jgi:hypothetical protein
MEVSTYVVVVNQPESERERADDKFSGIGYSLDQARIASAARIGLPGNIFSYMYVCLWVCERQVKTRSRRRRLYDDIYEDSVTAAMIMLSSQGECKHMQKRNLRI